MTWARKNLFSTWYNTLFTAGFAILLAWTGFRILRFVFVTGRWEIIRRNLTTLLVGLFPRAELWRVWIALFLLVAASALFAGTVRRRALQQAVQPSTGLPGTWRRAAPPILLATVVIGLRPSVISAATVAALVPVCFVAWRVGRSLPPSWFRTIGLVCAGFVVASFALLTTFGGVPPDDWGGLLLTVVLATGGILLSFPFGVALALGRRSSLPVVRIVSVGYIELIRGVPLITLLFMGSFVIGFVFPPGADRPSLVTRALIAIVMFTAAYIAEIVRGGLQSVGRGQLDAALAVGLRPMSAMRFIVLPQALRAVIPGLVGQFITLFKDTSLVAIIGLTELLGVAQALTSQRDFIAQGLHAETLVFASFIYWVVSYTMSKESRRLERRFGVGVR